MIDGRTPLRPELENLRRLAIEYLPAENSEPLALELDLLWAALQGGSTAGYSTGAVAGLIGDMCGARVRAIISNPQLQGSDDPPQPSR
ncbi:MAG: hypothetical protein WD651_01200 [Acidimicrobiia bacterium]